MCLIKFALRTIVKNFTVFIGNIKFVTFLMEVGDFTYNERDAKIHVPPATTVKVE